MQKFGGGKSEKREALCFSKFYFGSVCCSLQELDEYFSRLGDLSSKRKSDALHNRAVSGHEMSASLGLYLSGPPTEYILMLSEHWQLQDEVKYLALEIFDRFMSTLVSQLHELIHDRFRNATPPSSGNSNLVAGKSSEPCSSVQKSGASEVSSSNMCLLNSSDKSAHLPWVRSQDGRNSKLSVSEEEWEGTLVHLKGQCELRAVTCIMIASKMCSHYDVVTLSKGISILKKQGHRYNKDALLKSEIRILKAIDYQFHSMPTLHTYVTVILEILCRSKTDRCLAKFYPTILSLLNLFYYCRQSIFARVCETTLNRSGMLQVEDKVVAGRLLSAMNDFLLPSAAIITAAVYLKDKRLSDELISMLCQIIGVEKSELTEFSYIVLDVVLAPQT